MRLLLIVFIVVVSVCLSCKKQPISQKLPATDSIVVIPDGNALGPVISKTIDENGGNISSDDGQLQLTIPPHAINSSTIFSIQMVSSNMPNGIGAGYKVLPGNVIFNKPIQVKFSYSDSMITNSTEDFLDVAYREDDGRCFEAPGATVDTLTKTLTAQVNHFCTFYRVTNYSLNVDRDWLDYNEMATLNLKIVLAKPGSTDYILTSRTDEPRWELIGQGAIETDEFPGYCSYKAPDHSPSPNPVTIKAHMGQVTVHGTRKKTDWTLQKEIIVGSYFKVSLADEEFSCTTIDPVEVLDYGSYKTMRFSATGTYDRGVDVIVEGYGKGNFSFSPPNLSTKRPGTLMQAYDFLNNGLFSNYQDCQTGATLTTGGTVEITEFSEKPGGYIKGFVTGVLANYDGQADKCHWKLIPVTAKFVVKRAK